jgi:anti-anti-sigma regulatory factor/HAMP domain-containing protein
MNIPWLSRLSTQLTLTFTIVLFILIGLVTAVLIRGLDQTEESVTAQSRQGLEHQGQSALLSLTEREARLQTAEFEKAATATRHAARALSDAPLVASFDLGAAPRPLTRGPAGNRFDAAPGRASDVVVFSQIPDSPELASNIQQSEILNALFPSLLESYTSTVAIYYISAEGMTRYYPPFGLQDVVPPDFAVLDEVFFTIATPEQNPARATAWTPVYDDPAGNGLLITGSTPVYSGETFRGVIGIDLSLTAILSSVAQLNPTAHGYAMLIDGQGRSIMAPPDALPLFFGQASATTTTMGLAWQSAGNPALQTALAAMQRGQSGIQRVDSAGQSLFVAYAPLPAVGWSLVLVAPRDEVTAEAAGVTAAIRQGTAATLRRTLQFVGLLTVIALIAIGLLSRRLTRPIVALVEGTRALADDDGAVALPAHSRHELGVLAGSFNRMSARVTEAQQSLRELNQNLERTVHERTLELENERRSLQQALDDLGQMSTTIATLSAPIIPVLPGVVVVPIVGSLDATRLDYLQQELLRAVETLQATTVILDLTAVALLDPAAAHGFMQVIQSMKLLGAQPIIVGINPELAHNLVQSGSELQSVLTMQNLQAAVQHSIRRIGKR